MGLNKETSLQNAASRLLNPQTEEPKEQVEAESPEPEVEVEATLEQEVKEEESEVIEPTEEEDEGEVEEGEIETEDTQETPERYTVKVDGEEAEVTLEDLQSGYQRNSDYTQKTQALAAERKEMDNLKAQLEHERTQYLEANKVLLAQEYSELQQYETIDWATLQANDPLEYVTKQSEYMEAQRQAQVRVEGINTAAQQERLVQAEAQRVYLQTQQNELQTLLPESSTDEFRSKLAQYAQDNGYTGEDLDNLIRAKDVVMLNKARLYDELQVAKATVAEKKGPAKSKQRMKSAAPTGKTTVKARESKARRETLRKTGSLKDAAAVLLGK